MRDKVNVIARTIIVLSLTMAGTALVSRLVDSTIISISPPALSPLLPTPVRTPDYSYDYAKAAVLVASNRLHVVSGQPEVLLTRKMTLGEFDALNDRVQFPPEAQDRPMVLALVEGDFEVTGFRARMAGRVRYVFYLFDPDCRCVSFTGFGIGGKGDIVERMLALAPATPLP